MKNLVALLLSFTVVLPAQTATPVSLHSLTVDQIMRGPGLVGYSPSSVRWSGDGEHLYFEWKQASDPIEKPMDTWEIRRDGKELKRLSDEEARVAPPARGAESRDHQRVVYSRKGDVAIYDRSTGKTRRLTQTAEAETDPDFNRKGDHVVFTRESNLFSIDLADGLVRQLTDIRPAGSPPPPGEEKKGTDSQELMKKEERALLGIVDQRARVKEERIARDKKENPRKPYILKGKEQVRGFALSPDEQSIVAYFREPAERSKHTAVPNYVTENGYTADIPGRTNVGDEEPKSRAALIRVDTGEMTPIASGLKAKDDKGKEIDRDIVWLGESWSDDGTKLVMEARATDNKDRWLFAIDPATGKSRELYHLHDDAWVDGPGEGVLGWLPDNEHVYFIAEQEGWAQLYQAGFSNGKLEPLTTGKFEVHEASLTHDKKNFLLVTSEVSPYQHDVYLMPVTGGPRTKLTTEAGNYDVTPSPDEKWLAVVHSTNTLPPELYVMENRAGAPLQKLTTSPAPEFNSYSWIEPPIVEIPARDGIAVPGHLYKPAQWKTGGPAVIFVHGAGYLQNVHRWWSNYFREYMFHHLLMERGYLVLDIDYRGSAGYGRNWRTAIYRHMGGVDLDDQVDAARWLTKQHGVDAKRIGMYGGSYGGFITLMAMFTQPGVFAAGAALRPVTDWAHYNHGYTSDILNTPQKDLEAYKKSSPIYFAQGLQGALLICHGMVDVNVHFQDSVRLAQRLIELKKENWELAAYPAEDHGFVQPSSWADEYKRILKLFESNLKPAAPPAATAKPAAKAKK